MKPELRFVWRAVPLYGQPQYARNEKILQYFDGQNWVDVPVIDEPKESEGNE
jgi:hypothetical protein